MKISDIPSGEKVLIDANILIYASQRTSNQCIELLRRCIQDDLIGYTTTHILAEVTHILMLTEARDLGMITAGNPAKQLSSHPERIKALHRYEKLMQNLINTGIVVEPVITPDFAICFAYQHNHGFLTNDSLFLAVATRLGIKTIVSANHQFENAKGFKLFSPDDIAV